MRQKYNISAGKGGGTMVDDFFPPGTDSLRFHEYNSAIVSLRVILNSVEIPGVRDPSESVAVSHFPLVVLLSLNRNYPVIAYTRLI
jgi:hypothetical protein